MPRVSAPFAPAASATAPEAACGKAAARAARFADGPARARPYRRGETSTKEESWLSVPPSTASGGPGAPRSAPRSSRAPTSSGSPSTTSPTRRCSRSCSSTTPSTAPSTARSRPSRARSSSTAPGSRRRWRATPPRCRGTSLGVEVVIESSGRFRARADAEKHLEAGAKKVIVSAPAKEPDVTVALGVNFETYDPDAGPHHLQRLVHDELPRTGREGPARGARDPARRDDDRARLHRRPAAARRAAQGLPAARAAAANLVPTSTGAAKAIGLVVPALAGKLQGFAVRVRSRPGRSST